MKKIYNKTFLLCLIIIIPLVLFFYWGWFEKQYFKCVGMYDVYKGDKAYKQRDLQAAIDYYRKGLELYPEHYGAWYNLGNIYVAYEDYYSAVDAYEKAIEHNHHFTLARMDLGIVSTEELGDFDSAIEQYNKIINSRKFLWFVPFVFRNTKSERINRGLAYYNMGVAYREKALYEKDDRLKSSRDLKNAVDSYKMAAKILKDDYDTRYNLALAYHIMGDYHDAGLNYCKAIELKPMDYEAHYNLAVLLRHLKMYQEAYNEIEKATLLVSNDGQNSNSNVKSYIFDILNEMTKTLAIHNSYNNLEEKLDDKQNSDEITYVGGKIVATDALDRAMLKNFKTCQVASFFEKNKE